ncbi:MAG TPA: hypothetical protein IGS53_16750 [Leptolyngbyaceae cyanobacterium M33_DOE_097]|uniref:Uncharacterized protein n=1 Tax=Oscillatoriales cyanobacterium SpSt-418 TaxID=2282169 RepID=A0A7C3KJW4_9CYAN|nr:hypothetical protein [Leptolyngbyaceae cyanobacterium M33_DOE_097]
MDSKTVLDLARMGNTEAIAFLLNQWLKPYYVLVTVTALETCLQVSIKGAQPPLPELFVDLVAGHLSQLQVPFEQVELLGYALAAEKPAWSQLLDLHEDRIPLAVLEPPASEKNGLPLPALPANQPKALVKKTPESSTIARSLPNLAGQRSVQNYYLSQLKTPNEKEQHRPQTIIGLIGLAALLSSVAIVVYNQFVPQTAVSPSKPTAEAAGEASQTAPKIVDTSKSNANASTRATAASSAAKTGTSGNATATREGETKTAKRSPNPISNLVNRGVAVVVDAKVSSEVERLRKEYETFQVLAQYEPQIYQQFQEQLKAAAQNNALTPEKIQEIGRNLGVSVIPKYVQLTSDLALLDFATTRFNLLQQQAKRQPEVCRAELMTRGPNSVSASMSSNLKELDGVLATVIQTGATQPVANKSGARGRAALEKVMVEMGDRYGNEIFKATDPKAKIAPQKACEMVNDFWAFLLNLPDAEAASALRLLWTMNLSSQ